MKRKSVLFPLIILAVLCFSVVAAYAKKPEVIRHDAQYLDRQVSINLQWQSSESIVSVRVAAGKEVKVLKVDAYDNKKNRSGYAGEVSVVLQADPAFSQESIPYTIQLEDEDGQKSNLVTGKVALPSSASAGGREDDHWGKDRLAGSKPAQKDMIEQLRQVAQILAAPPFLHDVEVSNPGSGTVTFKTKATHTVGLKEINFRIFDGGNKQIDSQQISAAGKLWEGTSKDFTLGPGNYFVIAQAVDGSGSTSPEKRAHFTIAGAPQQPQQPQQQVPLLVVSIQPPDVIAKGAQWKLTTGDWKNSADSINAGLANGWYEVEFKDATGWKKPEKLKVSVEAGKTTTATGTYVLDTSFARIYTVNKDFEEGTMVGVEDKTVADQLQLSKTSTTLPFIWIPNSNEGTISKVDTKTGKELGRYRTGPNTSGSPSRTTVDQQGNCWVGNRNTGTVVKVGLLEAGQCVDRNKNGKIETSESGSPLPWGQDECVLYEVVLKKGSEGTYTPGENHGKYDGSPGPRGIAIDAKNNLWAGTYGTYRYYYVDGATGKILRNVDLSAERHSPYGAVVDANGILWSSDINRSAVLRLDPANDSKKMISLGQGAYGVGLDKNNHLFVAGWCTNRLARVNTTTGQVEWSKDGESCIRGVAVTNDGDVWTANSAANTVTRWSNDGVRKASIGGFNHPTGVAADAEGKVWVVNYGDAGVGRINPATNKVDLSVQIASGHYGYSDMTGIVARSMTTKLGTWTVTCDSQKADGIKWSSVSWASKEPQGTSVKVRVRSSADKLNWSAWEDMVKGVELKATPAARYIQVEATLQVVSGEASPILSDVTVNGK
jgi:streptogramin lyase